MTKPKLTTQTAVLGGGCFWCLEAAYVMVEGIEKTVSGYAGGHVPNPTYMRVASKTTGHAEVIQLTFDPNVISYADILEIFWVLHDPTSKDRQMYDVGPEYRSIILYENDEQKEAAEKSRAEAQRLFDKPIVTEIVLLEKFYEAEPEHQDFYRKNPGYGYCQVIIDPKLAKLRQKFAARLKQEMPS